MAEKAVTLGQEGRIAVMMLNRPEAYNAFDQEMVELLAEHLKSLAVEDSV